MNPHLSPQACSRCNPIECSCSCHTTEAELSDERRLARVETLPGRWERRYGDRHPAYFDGLDRAATDLRAALDADQ